MPSRRSLALLLAAPALRPAAAQVTTRMALLHLNDFHSRHEPIAVTSAACRAGEACFGGSARIATAIAEAREAARADGRAALLLEAGDAFLGSLFFSHHEGQAEAQVQRAWGVQGMALGNHEFDLGPEVLARYIAAVPFPVLSANLDATAEPILAGKIRPTIAFRREQMRIVVVGLTTPDTPGISSPGPNLRFTDPMEAANRAVWEARREGAATVVLLSHLGLTADRRLAAEVAGVDVILGGHSHTLVAPPVVVDGPDRPVLIAQAGAHGRWLGRLDLDLAADGRLAHSTQQMRELTAEIAEDRAVAALVAQLAAPLEALRRRVVARLPAALSNAGCGSAPCEIGELVAEAMRAAVDAEIGWQNGGGVRAGLPEGEITMGDVLAALPFGNTTARMVLRGSALIEALENGLARLPAPSGRFPQLAGLRFTADAARPAGSRIVAAEVRGAGGIWQPLDPGRAYSVATNNFLRRGGDGYTIFAEGALEARDDGPLLDEVLVRLMGR
ncbi:5'-nucleotidase C-terminal domain-containing protein [Sediminicoccus sp. KRV36]|uniref:bifunctional metallophosphatase/5'-nucleotidase n=1 Tax=Sediminicoccus sp. KRV36 TaxID=3133721 RepID=UPI00200C2DAE|nr:5'-nucleotidase C-terminal domain-containing protein [Sediminicoccus rosea]UPY37077.1 5'-nucleotidase C-terminal domain-containing protein [Sediminicoccus rosea]